METFLIKAAQLIAALALLVVIHEFGHYFFARIFGIRVEKFYLFFNPWFSLCKWKPKKKNPKYRADGTEKTSWRDTEYGIGWLPLGGYCKIAGMIDESMDKEQMAQPAKPDEFRARPAYQRLLVMVGGVLFNFILACVVYIGIALHWGEDTLTYGNTVNGMCFTEEAHAAGYADGDIILSADGADLTGTSISDALTVASATSVAVLRGNDTVIIHNPENFPVKLPEGLFNKNMPVEFPVYIHSVTAGSPAKKAGLEEGDFIKAINGAPVEVFTDLTAMLMANKDENGNDKEIAITIERDGKEMVFNATPENGKLGFVPVGPAGIFDVKHIDYNFFQAIPKGIGNGVGRLVTYVGSLKYLFTKEGAQSIGGFGAIGDLFPNRWDWRTFWEMAAFLSIILAFMNILPIPALDGGHVLFVLWEIITRRKPSEKFLERAQIAGMFFLLALLLYANGNDIYRFIFK